MLYLVRLAAGTGEFRSLRMVPLRARRLTLEPASAEDARWLAHALTAAGRPLGSSVEVGPEGDLRLRIA
jgi:poly-gamma-glutamate synthesis protein (capsule biosynthesis protein)